MAQLAEPKKQGNGSAERLLSLYYTGLQTGDLRTPLAREDKETHNTPEANQGAFCPHRLHGAAILAEHSSKEIAQNKNPEGRRVANLHLEPDNHWAKGASPKRQPDTSEH